MRPSGYPTLLKLLPWAIALAFLSMPFFWFSHGAGDYGGDSGRLYFFDPVNFLRHATDRTIASLNLPAIYWIPVVSILVVLQKLVFFNTALLLPLFDGLLFASAFLSVYFLIRELIADDTWQSRAASVLGGLFFVLSAMVSYQSYRFVPAYHAIAVYPWMLWFVVRYIKTTQVKYLLWSALLSLVFSINFAFDTVSTLASFVIFTGIFAMLYGFSQSALTRALKGCGLMALMILGVQAFHLIPQIATLFNADSSTHALVFSDAAKFNRGLNYFQGNRPWVRLIYSLIGFPQYHLYTNVGAPPAIIAYLYNYGIKYIWLFFVFPLSVVAGLYLHTKDTDMKRRLTFISLVGVFLLTLFFITANVFGSWGPAVYAKMFSIPGFSMFRSFYGVFSLVFTFFYALVFGFAGYYLMRFMRLRILGAVFFLFTAAVLVYEGVPLIRGDIANLTQDQTNNLSVSHTISQDFIDVLHEVQSNPLDFAMVSLPITSADYQILEGEYGGAYLGLPLFQFLAGRSTYGGLGNFDYIGASPFPYSFFMELARAKDYRTMNRWFSLMNVSVIFNNANPLVYRDSFKSWPYSKEIFDTFPQISDFEALVKKLGYAPKFTKSTYTLNSNDAVFLPRIYVPKDLYEVKDREEMEKILVEKNDYQLQSAFYAMPSKDISLPYSITHTPELEFKKENTNRYRIKAHKVSNPFPIVLSSAFSSGWKLYPVKPTETKKDSREFISPVYAGSVQNQNLSSISWLEAWRKNFLPESVHMVANNFSNLWWVDPATLDSNSIVTNVDGSRDLEFVLVYTPERFIQLGAVISIIVVLGIGGVLIYGVWVAKRNI